VGGGTVFRAAIGGFTTEDVSAPNILRLCSCGGVADILVVPRTQGVVDMSRYLLALMFGEHRKSERNIYVFSRWHVRPPRGSPLVASGGELQERANANAPIT
jgi:hypothetical protein